MPRVAPAAQPSLGERLALTLRANTVAVRAEFDDGSTETGFGIIVAEDQKTYWIATLDHVVRGMGGTAKPTTITVRVHGTSTPGERAELLPQRDQALDLAALRTPKPAKATWYPWCTGSAGSLARGDAVWFVGQAGRWYVPSEPGRVNEVDLAFGIVADALRTQVGSSGAPLVSTRGIVGLIASDAMGATHNAIPLNVVAERFASWKLPWSLKPLSLVRTRPMPLSGVDEALAKADRLRTEGDLAAANDHYLQALKIDPSDPLVLRRAYETQRDLALSAVAYPSELFMDDERSAEALRLIYRLLDLDEGFRDVELQLEIATLTRLAKGDWSIEYLLSSLEPYFGDARVRAEAGLLKSGYVSAEAGLDLLRNAHSELPDDFLIQRYLAFALQKSKDLRGAARAYARAVDLSKGGTTNAVLNRKASLAKFTQLLLKLEDAEPGVLATGNAPLAVADSARLLDLALAEIPEMDGPQEVHCLLARMRVTLRQRDVAEQKALKGIGWPPSGRLGYYVEDLASRRHRGCVELAAELLRESGSHPELLYALERHVLQIEPSQYTTPAIDDWLRPTVQIGHSGRVLATAVSPDGRRIVTGGDDSLRIWNAATGQVERVLGPQVGSICAVGFSRSGARVAAIDDGAKRAYVWDPATGRRIQSVGPIDSHPCSLMFNSADAILARRPDDVLATWGADSLPRVLAKLEHSVYALTISPDGHTVAVIPCCDRSNNLELRNAHNGALRNSIALRRPSRQLAYDSSGSRIGVVSGLSTGNPDPAPVIEILDGRTGIQLQVLRTDIDRDVESIAFSPDGAMLAIGSEQGPALEIWSVAEGRRKLVLGEGQVSGVAWMPDGHRLVAVYFDGAVRIWNVDTGESTQVFRHARGKNALVISPGERLLLVGTDGSGGSERVSNAAIWELDTRRLRCKIEHGGPFKLGTISPDHRWFALGNDSNYDVQIWDTQCKEKRGEVEIGNPRSLAFAPAGDHIAHVDSRSESSILLRDLGTFEVIRVLEGHERDVIDMEFNARNGHLASAGNDGTIRIWDPATGRQVQRIDAHPSGVQWVTWSPNGSWLASAGNVSEAAIWDAATGALRVRFSAFFESGSHALRFAPDGKTLVAVTYDSGSRATTLTRWSVSDGRFLGELYVGRVRFRSVLPAPDERTLALAFGKQEHGGPVLLVDLVTGKPRKMFRGLPEGGWLAVSPSGDIDGLHHTRH